MKETKVIAGFPATGKTYYYKNLSEGKVVLDSDSSNFSWVKDDKGNNTKTRHPDFPENYMQHIKDNLGRADIIFVSSHEEVQKALEAYRIDYTIFYPNISLKEEWIERFRERGNNDGFISFIEDNFEKFILYIEESTFPNKIELQDGEYIGDYLK